MVTFEEQFPSLTKKISSNPNKLLFSEREQITLLFNEKAIMNYCLDKQKVKKAIDSIEMNHERRLKGWDNCLILLKKELGL